jgi:G:T-mismatch repair DNA endonuclease (very short patch repair protein)
MKMICPVCNKELGNVPHYRSCNPQNLSKDRIKDWVFEFNFKPFIEEHGEKIKSMYVIEQRSVKELSDLFEISWGKMSKVLNKLGVNLRDIAESAVTTRTRQKYQTTCIARYGATNALSKNTTSYHKRNQTVKDKYGVNNVRQTTMVKDKINETMLDRYGVLRIAKFPKFRKHTPNRLEAQISSALTRLNIGHTFSHYVKRRQFDFLITGTKILIEVQGDFWHANPKYYRFNDQIKFFDSIKTVQSIWDSDEAKRQIAESYGYTIIYAWETDIKNMNDDELEKWLLTRLAAELRLPLPDQQQ